MLGLVVTDTLYRTHPDLPEGQLAKLRAAVVNTRALAEVARDLGLGEHIQLGRGEEATGGRDKSSILADTVEALIGAVYLSGGFEAADQIVHRLFDPLMEAAAGLGAGLDWKTSLQELTAEHSLGVPEYVIEDDGPDHEKTFTAQVRWARSSTARHRAHQEGGRAAGRRDRLPGDVAVHGSAPGRPSPPRRRRPRRPTPTCPSCPRSRSSASASRPTWSAAPSPRSTYCIPVRYGATWPAPTTSRPG